MYLGYYELQYYPLSIQVHRFKKKIVMIFFGVNRIEDMIKAIFD